jgi:hypothetical protein
VGKLRRKTVALRSLSVDISMLVRIWLFAFSALPGLAAMPSVQQIMATVAANQDRAQQLRSHYVYTQHVRVRALRKGGKLSREEDTTYHVLPTSNGVKKETVQFSGKYTDKSRVIEYKEPDRSSEGVGEAIDQGLVEGFRDGLMNDEKSKDGIAQDLFPLSTRELPKYSFRLKAREMYRGSPVYRVEFSPSKHRNDDERAFWAGEAMIDAADLQPVSIWTRAARGIPFWVRTAFGTNIQHLGFSVAYRKFADGVWFPVSYGGEFKLRAVFFYARTITISLENTDFRETNSKSTITYGSVR